MAIFAQVFDDSDITIEKVSTNPDLLTGNILKANSNCPCIAYNQNEYWEPYQGNFYRNDGILIGNKFYGGVFYDFTHKYKSGMLFAEYVKGKLVSLYFETDDGDTITDIVDATEN